MAQGLRILLLIPHLGGGGAEQVIALLARGLSRQKYDVHLGLVTESDAGPNDLPPWVTVHPLGARRVRAGAIRLLRLVWRLKPDVILSGMAHLNFLVLLLRPFFPGRRAYWCGKMELCRAPWPLAGCRGVRACSTGCSTVMPTGSSARRAPWPPIFPQSWGFRKSRSWCCPTR